MTLTLHGDNSAEGWIRLSRAEDDVSSGDVSSARWSEIIGLRSTKRSLIQVRGSPIVSPASGPGMWDLDDAPKL